MPKTYKVNGVDLAQIRNRNELRVIKQIKTVIEEHPDIKLERMDIEDLYALALNQLPPRYVQRGSIVLRESVPEEEILERVRLCFKKVYDNPKYEL